MKRCHVSAMHLKFRPALMIPYSKLSFKGEFICTDSQPGQKSRYCWFVFISCFSIWGGNCRITVGLSHLSIIARWNRFQNHPFRTQMKAKCRFGSQSVVNMTFFFSFRLCNVAAQWSKFKFSKYVAGYFDRFWQNVLCLIRRPVSSVMKINS